MARTKRASGSRFFPGLLLYVLTLSVFVVVGLRFLYVYIDAYEKTRPTSVVRQYMSELNADYVREHAAAFFDELDHNLQPEEESLQFIWSKMDHLSYVRSYDASAAADPDAAPIYSFKQDGDTMCRITLQPADETVFGFTPWVVSSEEFFFDRYISEGREFTVPDNYTVVCNGTPLSEDYIVEDGLRFSLLEQFYGSYDFPCRITYRIGNYLGELECTVYDFDGDPVEDEAQLTESALTDNCTAEEKAQIEAFVDQYIRLYVKFLSGAAGGGTTNYKALTALVVSGSDLASRLDQAREGLTWAQSRRDDIESITVNEMMNIGSGQYICSVTYLVNTLGKGELTLTTNNAKLVLVMTDDGLRASAQISV